VPHPRSRRVADVRARNTGRLLLLGAASVGMLFGSGVAQAASAPNVVGQKYSDATAAISGAGLTPVLSTTFGDRNAQADCLVVNQVSRTEPAPENSGGSQTDQVLLSLNCDSGEASAKTPGFSAGSPEGKAAAAAASSSAAAASASAAPPAK
jgi:hypothetical protein